MRVGGGKLYGRTEVRVPIFKLYGRTEVRVPIFMTFEAVIFLTILIFVAAMLYSSVGHAGASGYLAAMALFSLAPATMKPTALVLNIFVSIIATWKFYRAGCFSWKTFLSFALPAVPFAFIGGAITLPTTVYKPIVGIVLLMAAVRFFYNPKAVESEDVKDFPLWAAILCGIFIGLLSGLTGVGGGIFLSPLLLLMNWSETKTASGISAMFILVNSIAGLAGNYASVQAVPNNIIFFAGAAIIGGFIGAEYGSKKFGNPLIRQLLAVVLIIAGAKMIFG